MSYRGGSRVFVEEGFDLCLSGLCVQLARLSQQPSYSSQSAYVPVTRACSGVIAMSTYPYKLLKREVCIHLDRCS